MRITVKSTLFGLFSLLAIVSLAQGAMSVRALSVIRAATDDVATNRVPSLLSLGQLNVDYGDMRVAHAAYLASDAGNERAILAQVEEARLAVSEDIVRYKAMISDGKESALYTQFLAAADAYGRIWDQTRALKDAGKRDEAMKLLFDQGKSTYDNAGDLIQEAVDLNAKHNGENLEQVGMTIRTSLTSAYGAFFLAGFLAIVAMFLTNRRVIAPFARLTVYMGLLRQGNTEVTVPDAHRTDEVGEMATALEVFRRAAIEKMCLEAEADENRRRFEVERAASQERAEADAARRLSIATSGLAAGLKRLASGDLAFQLNEAFAPDFEALRHDFNASVRQLAETLEAILRLTSTIDETSREISQGASDLSRRTEQQAASLEETAAALDEITTNVGHSSQRADEARRVANDAETSAVRSGEVVARTVDAMSRIEQSSDQISNIIGVIDEIAFQTNLLALNAGVEAARAGDAGMGFAVVAQEVRELAQRSAQAAKEIKGLIQTSSSEVQNGVQLVSETGKVLKAIEQQILTINMHMEAIATSTREQALGLSEVNTAVNHMDQVTQQNAAMVEETTAASAALANDAAGLRSLVSQFNVTNAIDATAITPEPPANYAKSSSKAAPTVVFPRKFGGKG